jgi:hypothetical protein
MSAGRLLRFLIEGAITSIMPMIHLFLAHIQRKRKTIGHFSILFFLIAKK